MVYCLPKESRDKIRERQTKTVLELRPIVQDLVKASREALTAWKFLTESLESIAHLYDQFATLIPSPENMKDLGLEESLGISDQTAKVCKAFKKTVSRWRASDEVIEVRAQLYDELMVWRRTERRLATVTVAAVARKSEDEQMRAMLQDIKALRKKDKTIGKGGADAVTAELQAKIQMTKTSVKERDGVVGGELKSLLKKSILREPTGAAKTGYVLRRVGRVMAKAFDGFTKGGEDVDFTTPDILQTPVMGVPLELDYPANRPSLPATPASTEAEYGQGVPYRSSDEPQSDATPEDARVSVTVP